MRKLSIALLALSFAATAHAEWTVVSTTAEFSPGRRLEHRHLVARDGGTEATVDVALFSAKNATLRVIDNGAQDRDLATAMQSSNCIAGVNGGYFDPQFAPLGLRVIDGKTTSPLIRARLLTGVLSASPERGVEIARIGEFSRKRKLDAAVECGPFVVDLGVRVRGLDNTRSARRTFAAVARGGRALLGVTDEVTLAGLGDLLASPNLIDGFSVWRAMNLDGGSSTGFWFRPADGNAVSIAERKSVRDFVGVVPK